MQLRVAKVRGPVPRGAPLPGPILRHRLLRLNVALRPLAPATLPRPCNGAVVWPLLDGRGGGCGGAFSTCEACGRKMLRTQSQVVQASPFPPPCVNTGSTRPYRRISTLSILTNPHVPTPATTRPLLAISHYGVRPPLHTPCHCMYTDTDAHVRPP